MSLNENIINSLCEHAGITLGTLFGIYLGFPKCCINQFENDWHIPTPFPLYGTGYVPCKKCCKKSSTSLIKTIKKNRICDLPFPACHDIMNYKHFTNMVLHGDLINIAVKNKIV